MKICCQQFSFSHLQWIIHNILFHYLWNFMCLYWAKLNFLKKNDGKAVSALRIHIAFVIEDFNLKHFWWMEWYLVYIFFWKKWRVTRVTIDLRAKNGKKMCKALWCWCIGMVNLTLMCLLGNFNKYIIMWFCWPFQCMYYKLSSYKCYSLTKKKNLKYSLLFFFFVQLEL